MVIDILIIDSNESEALHRSEPIVEHLQIQTTNDAIICLNRYDVRIRPLLHTQTVRETNVAQKYNSELLTEVDYDENGIWISPESKEEEVAGIACPLRDTPCPVQATCPKHSYRVYLSDEREVRMAVTSRNRQFHFFELRMTDLANPESPEMRVYMTTQQMIEHCTTYWHHSNIPPARTLTEEQPFDKSHANEGDDNESILDLQNELDDEVESIESMECKQQHPEHTIFDVRAKMEEEVVWWLRDVLCMGEYVSMFLENGYDDLRVIMKTMDDPELQCIGVQKRGHKKKILLWIHEFHLGINELNCI